MFGSNGQQLSLYATADADADANETGRRADEHEYDDGSGSGDDASAAAATATATVLLLRRGTTKQHERTSRSTDDGKLIADVVVSLAQQQH